MLFHQLRKLQVVCDSPNDLIAAIVMSIHNTIFFFNWLFDWTIKYYITKNTKFVFKHTSDGAHTCGTEMICCSYSIKRSDLT